MFASASNDDFYDAALRRGLTAFDAGSYDAAIVDLRLAAFGFLQDISRYETIHSYIAVASARLKRNEDARTSLYRIISAERVEHHLEALALPVAIRIELAAVAKTLLPPLQAKVFVIDVSKLLADAQRALAAGDVATAREGYTSLLTISDLSHESLLKAGEGLYRARDFKNAVQAFDRAGQTAKGEEAFRYYYAVSLYEVGRYRDAKRELAAALPFVEATTDVQQYRAKIEQAPE